MTDLDAPSSSRAKLVLGVEGMLSTGAEQAVEKTLAKLPGVSAKSSFDSQTVHVEFDRTACAIPEIVRRLDALGLRLRGDASRAVAGKPLIPGGASPRDVVRWLMRNRQLGMALIGGALLLAAFLVHVMHGPNWLRIALIIPCHR